MLVFMKGKQKNLSRFFFDGARRKEKANKKKRRFVGLRAPHPRQLLKKLDQNFHTKESVLRKSFR